MFAVKVNDVGELERRSSVRLGLAEDLELVPSTHMVAHKGL